MTHYPTLTDEQWAAVMQFIVTWGRTWKAKLRDDWMSARCPEGSVLRSLRNSHGPSWLRDYRHTTP